MRMSSASRSTGQPDLPHSGRQEKSWVVPDASSQQMRPQGMRPHRDPVTMKTSATDLMTVSSWSDCQPILSIKAGPYAENDVDALSGWSMTVCLHMRACMFMCPRVWVHRPKGGGGVGTQCQGMACRSMSMCFGSAYLVLTVLIVCCRARWSACGRCHCIVLRAGHEPCKHSGHLKTKS